MRFLARELHRTWFLWWRLPIAKRHEAAARRNRRLADQHEAAMLATARRALALSRLYPSLHRGGR